MTNQYNQNLCNACGELECLCRPRFFAGQLLTEEDLNRLDQYIVKKQRLHNRHLHGWGVVCGLELRCHPCDNDVLVTSGYALSPCGDDIVVCEDEQVDICKLIRECLKQERQAQPCETYTAGNVTGCEDENWLLMIRYEEQPSRGITALRNATAEARCQPCDGVTFGGCDCDNNGKPKRQSYTTSLHPQPAQCEPTVLCEGYRYEVCRVSSNGMDQDPQQNAMEWRFNQCVEPFTELIERLEKSIENLHEQSSITELNQALTVHSDCCNIKRELIDLVTKHADHNCTLQEDARLISCPEATETNDDYNEFRRETVVSLTNMTKLLEIGLKDCLCSALLPQREINNDPRVVLGRVTVSRSGCKVVNVCNWITERKFATTPPNLEYWLSWLLAPSMQQLRQDLEDDFCEQRLPYESNLFRTRETPFPVELSSLLVNLLSSQKLRDELNRIMGIIAP